MFRRAYRVHCLVILAVALRADSRNQAFEDFVTPMPVKRGDVLLIGVVGGWERWDHPERCVRRTALRIQDRKLARVHIETVENHKLELAEMLVRRAFDADRNGSLEPEEASAARVVVFGQSLGGRAVLRLCRTLHLWGVPVELALLVDAFGKDGYTVPPNVRTAANFFQRDHIVVKGASLLHPADPAATRILVNRKLSYKGRYIPMPDRTWTQRTFMGSHIKLEYDEPLWAEIEALLVKALETARARD